MKKNIFTVFISMLLILFYTGSLIAAEIELLNGKKIKAEIMRADNVQIEIDPEGEIPFDIIPMDKIKTIKYENGKVVSFSEDGKISYTIPQPPISKSFEIKQVFAGMAGGLLMTALTGGATYGFYQAGYKNAGDAVPYVYLSMPIGTTIGIMWYSTDETQTGSLLYTSGGSCLGWGAGSMVGGLLAIPLIMAAYYYENAAFIGVWAGLMVVLPLVLSAVLGAIGFNKSREYRNKDSLLGSGLINTDMKAASAGMPEIYMSPLVRSKRAGDYEKIYYMNIVEARI